MMFYGDFHPNGNLWVFLTHFETFLSACPGIMECKKYEYFYNHLHLGWDAEDWYEEFKKLTPGVLTLWATLCKYFHIKWLDANPKKIYSKSQKFPHPPISQSWSQPIDCTPVIPKHKPTTPKFTTSTFTSKMTPKAAKSCSNAYSSSHNVIEWLSEPLLPMMSPIYAHTSPHEFPCPPNWLAFWSVTKCQTAHWHQVRI